ncbi:MAG: MBL fold metallo-hydrolase [Bacteroidota bacterium]
MQNRRRFLKTLGLVAAAQSLLADENPRKRSRWDLISQNDPPTSPEFAPDPSTWDDSALTAAWIGHATVLINFYGTWIITDPVFSDRIGLDVAGLFTIGPRRLVHPALTFDKLPKIDIVLVSHGHMDHLDTPTIKRFDRKIPVVIAKNTFDIIEPHGFQEVYELDWGEWAQVGDVKIEAFEVKHFGWRYPWENDRSKGFRDGRSYNAYLLTKNGRSVLFGGDTAFHEMFKKIGERKLTIDLAIMPIGAYDPWIRNHANPEQALAMTDHAGAYHMLPIHYRTFIQSDEPAHEPMERLKAATLSHPDRIVIDAIGQTWSMKPGA